MKKFLLLSILIIAVNTFAQIDLNNKTSIGAHGGLFLPYSSEIFKSGINLGFDIQYKINPIYMFFNLTYNISSRKNNLQSEYYKNTSNTGLLEISIGTKIKIAETNIKYFIDGGLGVYNENKSSYEIKINGITTSHPSDNNTSLGGNFGVSGEYPITQDIDFVAKVKYHLYFGVGDAPFLNTYFGILGGIKYNVRF